MRAQELISLCETPKDDASYSVLTAKTHINQLQVAIRDMNLMMSQASPKNKESLTQRIQAKQKELSDWQGKLQDRQKRLADISP